MNVAFIPVRGGSKSIPRKNIRPLCGRPLVWWTVKAAVDCAAIDAVYVATDDAEIARVVSGFGIEKVQVVSRGAETATDTASTESALLEFAEAHEFDTVALVQATSPLLAGADLDKGFALYAADGVDSVLSVVRQKRFIWAEGPDGTAAPQNYDHNHRPRRQEFDGFLVENGAFYITSRAALLASQNRLSGRIRAVEMDEDSYFEIDEPSDWLIAEALLAKRQPAGAAPEKPPEIRMFLTDCDGCLTDGGMYYSENGDELKKFNTRDGMAFQLLREKGIITGIVTSEDVNLVRRRAKKLKLDACACGVKNKAEKVRELSRTFGVPMENIAYVGDDINDLEVIGLVGFGCCVNNAVPAVKAAAKYIAATDGGAGAIREIVEMLLGQST